MNWIHSLPATANNSTSIVLKNSDINGRLPGNFNYQNSVSDNHSFGKCFILLFLRLLISPVFVKISLGTSWNFLSL